MPPVHPWKTWVVSVGAVSVAAPPCGTWQLLAAAAGAGRGGGRRNRRSGRRALGHSRDGVGDRDARAARAGAATGAAPASLPRRRSIRRCRQSSPPCPSCHRPRLPRRLPARRRRVTPPAGHPAGATRSARACGGPPLPLPPPLPPVPSRCRRCPPRAAGAGHAAAAPRPAGRRAAAGPAAPARARRGAARASAAVVVIAQGPVAEATRQGQHPTGCSSRWAIRVAVSHAIASRDPFALPFAGQRHAASAGGHPGECLHGGRRGFFLFPGEQHRAGGARSRPPRSRRRGRSSTASAPRPTRRDRCSRARRRASRSHQHQHATADRQRGASADQRPRQNVATGGIRRAVATTVPATGRRGRRVGLRRRSLRPPMASAPGRRRSRSAPSVAIVTDVVHGSKPGASAFTECTPGSTGRLAPQVASARMAPSRFTTRPGVGKRNADHDARERRFERGLAAPGLLGVLGAVGARRHRRRLAELRPRARGPPNLLVAVGEIEQDAGAGVELPGRLQLRARRRVLARLHQLAALFEHRPGGGLILRLRARGRRDQQRRSQGRQRRRATARDSAGSSRHMSS